MVCATLPCYNLCGHCRELPPALVRHIEQHTASQLASDGDDEVDCGDVHLTTAATAGAGDAGEEGWVPPPYAYRSMPELRWWESRAPERGDLRLKLGDRVAYVFSCCSRLLCHSLCGGCGSCSFVGGDGPFPFGAEGLVVGISSESPGLPCVCAGLLRLLRVVDAHTTTTVAMVLLDQVRHVPPDRKQDNSSALGHPIG